MDEATLTANEVPDTLAGLRQQLTDTRSSLAACLLAMRAERIDQKWRMVVAEATAVLAGEGRALQPTRRRAGYPAQVLVRERVPCPVCATPGWVVACDDGSTVTLHSEYSTADGEPIIDDACWTSE